MENVGLGPADHDRVHEPVMKLSEVGRSGEVPAVSVLSGLAVALGELPEARELLRGQMADDRPQFGGPIEDGRASEEHLPRRGDGVDPLGALRLSVLHVVALVDDEDVPVATELRRPLGAVSYTHLRAHET